MRYSGWQLYYLLKSNSLAKFQMFLASDEILFVIFIMLFFFVNIHAQILIGLEVSISFK